MSTLSSFQRAGLRLLAWLKCWNVPFRKNLYDLACGAEGINNLSNIPINFDCTSNDLVIWSNDCFEHVDGALAHKEVRSNINEGFVNLAGIIENLFDILII
jgi:hypothetical protein